MTRQKQKNVLPKAVALNTQLVGSGPVGVPVVASCSVDSHETINWPQSVLSRNTHLMVNITAIGTNYLSCHLSPLIGWELREEGSNLDRTSRNQALKGSGDHCQGPPALSAMWGGTRISVIPWRGGNPKCGA